MMMMRRMIIYYRIIHINANIWPGNSVIYYVMGAHLVTKAFDFNSVVNPSKLQFGKKT
jgi:hypothetical protein